MSKDKRELTKEEKAMQHKYSGWGAPEHEKEPAKPEKKKHRHVEPPKDDNGNGE